MRFAKSLQPERQQIYETANFQELQPLQKKSNITIEEEIQYPQKITKEGLMVPNNGELNHPSKIDEILSKAKNLQNKLNNFQFDVKPTIASNNNNNFLLSFQAKREENQLKPFLFDTLISDNKLIEYPIEKIGDIISKKSLNPELESQKLKLDEAGYMDTFERKEKKKKNMIEEPAILLMENRSNQKKFERDSTFFLL